MRIINEESMEKEEKRTAQCFDFLQSRFYIHRILLLLPVRYW